jgi:hypothetical protein
MVYEDVYLKHGETLSQLALDYGLSFSGWRRIWEEPKNAHLVMQRKHPESLLVGDKIIIPIDIRIISKEMTAAPKGNGHFQIKARRSGGKGKNIKWVQTVFGDNQPMFPPSPYSVDLPTDDDEPFYYTEAEMLANSNLRTGFYDAPFRFPPLDRTTTWRAVLSLGIVTGKRVSIFEPIVWGVDFGKDGHNNIYKPRSAHENEIVGHIQLLKNGHGKTQSFKTGGWTFRKASKF